MTYGPTWERMEPECRCESCGYMYAPHSRRQRFCRPQCSQDYYEKEQRRVGRFRIFERDEFRCIYCGKSSVEDATGLHVDHIIPRVAGGEDIAGNLVTACQRCNLEKSCKLMSESNTMRTLAEVQRRNLAQDIEPRLTIKL